MVSVEGSSFVVSVNDGIAGSCVDVDSSVFVKYCSMSFFASCKDFVVGTRSSFSSTLPSLKPN